MADINNVNNNSNVLGQYDIANKQTDEAKSNELGRDEFLELMIAQMENQSPLDPQKNEDFIAQLAQFSTVEGIEKMASGFGELSAAYRSSQTLQATSLVGSSVTLDGKTESDLVWGDVIFGTIDVPAGSDNLTLTVQNEYGEPVEQIELGYQSEGELTVKWDGMNLEVGGKLVDIDYEKFQVDADGNPLPHPEGTYSFVVSGNVGGSAVSENLAVSMSTRVDSVSILPDNTVVLNLAGGQKANIGDIKQINDVM